jgi:hypothetical protein
MDPCDHSVTRAHDFTVHLISNGNRIGGPDPPDPEGALDFTKQIRTFRAPDVVPGSSGFGYGSGKMRSIHGTKVIIQPSNEWFDWIAAIH